MIKGCEKRIIHIKSTNSPYFEEAYFIIKDGGRGNENDMVREAMKIAESTCGQKNKKYKKVRPSKKALITLSVCTALFILGAAVTVALIV